MTRLRRLALAVLMALPLLAAAALWLAIDTAPAVPESPAPALGDIARASALLQQHDPRRALPGITRAAVLSARDIELLLAQGGKRFGLSQRVKVAIAPRQAELRGSLPLNRLGLGDRWCNVVVRLRQTDGVPEIERLRVGALPLPGVVARLLLPPLVQGLGLAPAGELALQTVNRVTLRSSQAVIAFAWPDNLEQRLTDSLLPAHEQERMQAYAQRLNGLTQALVANPGAPRTVSLARLMPPLFALAAERSRHSHQPALENRAVLLLLARLVNVGELQSLGKGPRLLPALPRITVTLAGRTDTPKHYLVSAALAIEGGGPLSDAIGLYKEVSDSQGGSGFSFNDLAADRAGTRFGLLATASPESVQSRVAAGVQERDLLPSIADLPEDLQDPDFRLRFGGVGAPDYLRMMAAIESRLDQLPLLAKPPAASRGKPG